MVKQRPHKRAWSQPLAELVPGIIDPMLAKQGFAEATLILHWDDIVGERLAAMSQPIKLQWPPRSRQRNPKSAAETANLVVRVEGGFALELQHVSGVVIERVNAHLGWRCVGKLLLKQGPLERPERGRAPRHVPNAASRAAAADLVADVADAPLRAALVRLGSHVLARS